MPFKLSNETEENHKFVQRQVSNYERALKSLRTFWMTSKFHTSKWATNGPWPCFCYWQMYCIMWSLRLTSYYYDTLLIDSLTKMGLKFISMLWVILKNTIEFISEVYHRKNCLPLWYSLNIVTQGQRCMWSLSLSNHFVLTNC